MIEDLNARFVWTQDKGDRWTLLDATAGLLRGDCEDYAMTALYILAGRSWARFWWMVITFKAVFWMVRHAGYGPGRANHVALWVRGLGWIDSSAPAWATRTPHQRKYPLVAPVLALRIAFKR